MSDDGGRTAPAGSPPRDVVAGRYRITGRLGRGGMGTVWRAEDELLHRPVAVKELHLGDGESVTHTDKALREARSVARIRHPHVIVVYDVQEQDGRPWIVMELVDGRSLADILAEDGPLEPREAARIGAAVAGALRAAHASEVQHRDVKPANVLIERGTGRVVLTDFGIARVAGSATISETGSFVGSPEYTAPERMSGRAAGPESDLWSLGALLCAAVDGESPFHRDSIGEIVHAVAIDTIRTPEAAAPLLPVVTGLLDRDPSRRMGAAQVQTLLMAYAETGQPPPTQQVPVVPPAPAPDPDPAPYEPRQEPPRDAAPGKPERPEPPSASRPRGRGRRTLAAAAGVLVLALGGGALAAVLVVGHDKGDATAAPPPTTAATTKPTTATTPPTTPPTTPALPTGYERVQDPAGFSVALPAGYVRDAQRDAQGVLRIYYWSPDRAFRFGEREQHPDPRGPYAVLRDQDLAGPKAGSVYPGYRDGVITETTQHGQPAALWQFTYDGFGGDGIPRRTFDLCWTEGGRMYDMWLSAPIEQVERVRTVFDTAVAAFRTH
ncbi:serine/threonine-protein kinase [Actinacidiphila alni]|nr:serine/threonine-protein kinase [Actinacidiphila alni]